MITKNAEVSAVAGAAGPAMVKGIVRPGLLIVALSGDPASAAVARSLLRRALGSAATDEVLVCASELVANAIVHSRSGLPGGWFIVTAQVQGSAVLVSVLDEGARTPQDPPARGWPTSSTAGGWPSSRRCRSSPGRPGRSWA